MKADEMENAQSLLSSSSNNNYNDDDGAMMMNELSALYKLHRRSSFLFFSLRSQTPTLAQTTMLAHRAKQSLYILGSEGGKTITWQL